MFDTVVNFISKIIGALYQVTVDVGFPSYALAIIMITIIIKLLLYPLMAKQMKSMMNMQEVQPKLTAMQAKYKNNPEKLNQEMMKLYKDYDINPMAGCLPLLIQMPILVGLYNALMRYSFEPAEHAAFLWINNLNSPDPFYILPILVGLSMFVQQKLSMGVNSGAAMDNPMMKSMLYVMPPMMAFISIQFPAGLCLYWSLFSILGIFQQMLMNKQRAKRMVEIEARRAAEEEELKEKKRAAAIARKKKKGTSKKSDEEIIEAVIQGETTIEKKEKENNQ